jgi:hypothetical protein
MFRSKTLRFTHPGASSVTDVFRGADDDEHFRSTTGKRLFVNGGPSVTSLLAKLGNSSARQRIAEQRQAAVQVLCDALDKTFGKGAAQKVGLADKTSITKADYFAMVQGLDKPGVDIVTDLTKRFEKFIPLASKQQLVNEMKSAMRKLGVNAANGQLQRVGERGLVKHLLIAAANACLSQRDESGLGGERLNQVNRIMDLFFSDEGQFKDFDARTVHDLLIDDFAKGSVPGYNTVVGLAKAAAKRSPEIEAARASVRAAATQVRDADILSFMQGDVESSAQALVSMGSLAGSITDVKGRPLKQALKEIIEADPDVSTLCGKASVIELVMRTALGSTDSSDRVDAVNRLPEDFCKAIALAHAEIDQANHGRSQAELTIMQRDFNIRAFASLTLMPGLRDLVDSLPASDRKNNWLEVYRACSFPFDENMTPLRELASTAKRWGGVYQSFMSEAAERGRVALGADA